jgi:hypothetical protein
MSADSSAERPGKARVCVVSQRGVNRLAAWCSNYEFEDVIGSVDDVDLFELSPGAAYAARKWIVRRMIWKPGLRQLVPHLNPGVQPIALTHDYDLFVYICATPADLFYLGAIDGWRDRCRKKVCYIVEFFAGWTKEFAYHLSLLKEFDHITFCFSGSVDAAQGAIGQPCHHVPLGADVLRFTPYPNPPERCIDVYSMGRRPESVHRALLDQAARKEIFYIYDTIPGLLIQPRDHREHRELIASCGQRARFFVTYPAKVDAVHETRGQSEVGARFYEGAATGAVMIGQAPTVPAFKKDFDWPGAVIDIGLTNESLHAALSPFRADPELAARLGRRNAIEALRRFDWSYRWNDILAIAGLQPSRRLEERLARLSQLARLAEASPAGDRSLAACQV